MSAEKRWIEFEEVVAKADTIVLLSMVRQSTFAILHIMDEIRNRTEDVDGVAPVERHRN